MGRRHTLAHTHARPVYHTKPIIIPLPICQAQIEAMHLLLFFFIYLFFFQLKLVTVHFTRTIYIQSYFTGWMTINLPRLIPQRCRCITDIWAEREPPHYWTSPSHAQSRKKWIWPFIFTHYSYTCYHETWRAITICYSVRDGRWNIFCYKNTCNCLLALTDHNLHLYLQRSCLKAQLCDHFILDMAQNAGWCEYFLCVYLHTLSFILCNGRSWTACWLKSGILWDEMIWAEALKASRGLLLLSLLSSYVPLYVCAAYCIWTLKSHCSLSPSDSLYLSSLFLSLFSPLCSQSLLMHLRSMNGFL